MNSIDSISYAYEFNKRLSDLASGVWGPAITWRSGATGTHGGSAHYIMSSLSEAMDLFIDEYLRVNADAC